MASTKEIQTRMHSIQDTMKITNAMYMISSAKLKKQKRPWTSQMTISLPYRSPLTGFLRTYRM